MPEQISIAANPDKKPFLVAAAKNAIHSEEKSAYRFHYYADTDLLRAVAGRDFRYFCPSSAFSIPELERYLSEAPWADQEVELDLRPFAATPIVLLMRPEFYAAVGMDGPVGWRTLLSSHAPCLMQAHTGSADGLAVLAAMATAAGDAAAGDAAELSLDTLEAGQHDEFVDALQSRVTEYGPCDAAVAEHALADGRWRTDVVALQESSAYAVLARYQDLPAVIVHPADGTAWAHSVLGRMGPPGFLDEPAATELLGALRDPRMRPVYGSHGFRSLAGASVAPPAPAHVQIVGSPGPQPSNLPDRRLMRTLRKRGAALKRSADVCLLLDRSSSMAGHRLSAAKRGLTAFLDSVEGAEANACVIVFADSVVTSVPLQPVTGARAEAGARLSRILATGPTALLDAVSAALDLLEGTAGGTNLKAVVALTDGEENSSSHTTVEVERRLRDADVLFFGIAYGNDAGRKLLEQLARSCGGHSVVTDENGIRAAYELISRHL
jgi:Mg-chelatase subunit ChlD